MKLFLRYFLLLLAGLTGAAMAQGNSGFAGNWVTDPELSSALDPFSRIELEIEVEGTRILIKETYTTGRRNNTEFFPLDTAREVNVVPVTWWIDNRHIGAFIGGDCFGNFTIRGLRKNARACTLDPDFFDPGGMVPIQGFFPDRS